MTHTRRDHLRHLVGALSAAALPVRGATADFAAWSDAQKENFLKTSKIESSREIGHGVTKPVQVELALGAIRHSAKVQVVDKELPDFFCADGKPVPMRDAWRFNVATYRIDRLLDLRMVTVVVPRTFRGKAAGFSWWVDDVQFEEVERIKREIQPHDPEDFERQRALVRVFDELIINIDRNLSNLLITKSWKLALIDHSRCFTPYHGIRNEANLGRCSRKLLDQMRKLTAAAAQQAAGTHLTRAEVAALMARRDRIVASFEKAASEKGEENVLFS